MRAYLARQPPNDITPVFLIYKKLYKNICWCYKLLDKKQSTFYTKYERPAKFAAAGKECQMDIAGLSAALSMSDLQTNWGMKMLDKTMDTAKSQGAQLSEMLASVPAAQMELSVNPYVGSQFDVRV